MSYDVAEKLVGNRYELLDKLGEGGMGSVYRALDRLTGQQVALKQVTSLGDGADEDSIKTTMDFRLALAREFKVLASLKHPQIINVLDYGFDAHKHPYIAMELLSNAQTLLTAAQDNPLPTKLEKIIQVLQALAYLHRRDILHRDLKPANVLVNPDGALKVLDFGLASAVEDIDESDEIAGTLNYMAPEIFEGQSVSQASDLYAVGVMAYELLVGRHPFHEHLNRLDRLIQAVMSLDPDMSPLEHLTDNTVILDQEIGHDDKTVALDRTQILQDSAEDDNKPKFDDTSDTAVIPRSDFDLAETPTTDNSYKTEIDPNIVAANIWKEIDTQAQILDEHWGEATATSVIGRLLTKLPELRYSEAYDVIHDLAAAFDLSIPLESAAIRESFLQAARFVGREQELGLLTNALDEVADEDNPKGSTWLVSGESGVGKSRVLDELRSYALVKGVMVLQGQAVSGGGMSYQLWREPLRRMVLSTQINDVDASILKDLVPDISDLLQRPIDDPPQVEDAAYKRRLHETVTSVFKNHNQPTLLLLEDLQWTVESLELLKILNGIVVDTPLLIVGSFRSDERPEMPEELSEMQLITLERFDEAHITELTVSMLGEAGQQEEVQTLLQRETEGNVFFMIEVVRVLAEEAGGLSDVGRITLPETVFAGGIQNVVQRRIDRVPVRLRELLKLAAIAGRELDLALFQSALEYDLHSEYSDINLDEWLTICGNSGVLEKVGTDWHFSHDKVRQIILDSISDDERPTLHGIVAQAMELAFPDERDDRAVVLARHWRAANNTKKEFEYVRLAGDVALHTGAFEDTVRHFSRATLLLFELDYDETQQIGLRAEFLTKIGEALEHQGDYEGALERLHEALKLNNDIDNRKGAALALNVLSDVAWRPGDYEQAMTYCEDALEICRKIGDKQGQARALNRKAMIYVSQGTNYDEAQSLLEQSLELEKATDYKPGIATVTNNLGLMLFAQGKYDEAYARFQETLDLARESGERVKIATALMNLGVITGEKRQYPEAIRYTEEALAIMRDTGNRRGESILLRNLGGLAEYQQDWERAEDYMQQSLEISRTLGSKQGIAATQTKLAHIIRAQNRTEDAATLYLDALEIAKEIDSLPILLEIVIGMAGVIDDPTDGLTLLGFAMNHPALFENIRNDAQPIYEGLKAQTTSEQAEDAFEAGRALDLETVLEMLV